MIIIEYIDTLSKMDNRGFMYNENNDICIHKDGDVIYIDYSRVFEKLYNNIGTITGISLRILLCHILSRYYRIHSSIVKNFTFKWKI